MKYLVFLSVIFTAIWSMTLTAQDTLILDKIIAKIGSEVVFHSDVEEQMAMMRERKASPGSTERCLVLESLIAKAS